jgi:hypothetical protein
MATLLMCKIEFDAGTGFEQHPGFEQYPGFKQQPF